MHLDHFKFDLETGNVLKKFNSGTAPNTVWGLTVRGEITAAQPCTLPAFADTTNGNPIRQSTDELRKVPYGGMEFRLPDGSIKFLPYDNGNPSIADEGCYLISAVMVINYYAALQGSDFRTDPITLNSWMAHNITNNNAGYSSGLPLDDQDKENKQNPTHVNGAGILPATIIQYAKSRNINMDLNGPVLTGGRNSADDEALDASLCSLNPAIISVRNGGHFVPVDR